MREFRHFSFYDVIDVYLWDCVTENNGWEQTFNRHVIAMQLMKWIDKCEIAIVAWNIELYEKVGANAISLESICNKILKK